MSFSIKLFFELCLVNQMSFGETAVVMKNNPNLNPVTKAQHAAKIAALTPSGPEIRWAGGPNTHVGALIVVDGDYPVLPVMLVEHVGAHYSIDGRSGYWLFGRQVGGVSAYSHGPGESVLPHELLNEK